VSNHFFSFLFRHEFGQEKKYRTPSPSCFFFWVFFLWKNNYYEINGGGFCFTIEKWGHTTKTRVDFAFFLSQLLVGGVCVCLA
jgi:hypothetical protein